VEVALGVAECAAAQTVHFTASVVPEWWCETNATADQNVSNAQKNAIRFEIDRINRTRNKAIRLYTEITNERNQSTYPGNCHTSQRVEHRGNCRDVLQHCATRAA
jgi:hypothetical protein